MQIGLLRIALITGLAVVPFTDATLAQFVGPPMAGAHVTRYNWDSSGNYTGKEYDYEPDSETGIQNRGIQMKMSCKPPKQCEVCGFCHSSNRRITPQQGASAERLRQMVVESAARHETTYFARAEVRLSPGERLSWGTGPYLAMRGSQLALYSGSGKLLAEHPTGTRVLKTPNGEVFGLHFPASGEPRIVSRTP
jgi:hypothetical protein